MALKKNPKNPKAKLIKSHYDYEATVIVMNKNRIDLLKNCLESIEEYTKDVNYELIIVDNLSTDGSRDYIQTCWSDKAVLIFEKDTTSYAASNNRAMKWAYGKYIYLLNNDCEVRPGWLRNAIDFAEKNPDVGHVASLVLWPDNTVMSHGANLKENGISIVPFYKKDKEDKILKQQGNYAYAGFGLYKRDICEKVGYLPEYPVPIYFDDTSYSMEVWRAGFTVRYCPESVIIHALYHDHNRKHHEELGAAAIGQKCFMDDWGNFLKENKGFSPDFPFTGKRPYRNSDKPEKVNEIKEQKEVILIISNVEFIDGGGSKRPANLARAFSKKNYKVVFVNLYPCTETKKYKPEEITSKEILENIEFISIDKFDIKEFLNKYKDNCKYALIELPHEKTLPIIKEIKKNTDIKVVIEYLDNWNTALGSSWYKEKIEKEIFSLVDRIHVANAELLPVTHSKSKDKEIRYISNGVDIDLFDYKKEYERPKDLPEGKYVFYMGALWGSWIDFQLIEDCMKKYKDINFVFCGGGLNSSLEKKWKKMKNCYLLGLRPVMEMPAYIQYSEVCIIPFIFDDKTNIVRYISPLKAYEYAAMNKPILSTYFKEIEEIVGVNFADNKKDYINRLGLILKNKFKTKDLSIDTFIKKNSWINKAEQIIKEEPLISIVLPVFNGEKYIEDSIESVLNQTHKNFELIIVNDGSTDKTSELIEKYKSDYRVKIINQENLKLPAALNTGFKEAKGEFYTWTSADNIMLKNQLEVLLKFLKDNTNFAMVYSNYQFIDEAGKPLYNGTCRIQDRDPENTSLVKLLDYISRKELIEKKNNYIGASFLYRGEVAKDIGEYDINLFGAEDFDYWLRIASKYKIGHCEKVLYKYRVHSETLNAKAEELNIQHSVCKCINKHINFRLPSIEYKKNKDKTTVIFQVDKLISGGLEKVVYSTVKALDKSKYEAVILSGEKGGEFAELFKKDGYKVFCYENNINILRKLIIDIEPDIVNFHYSLFGLDEYKKSGIKTVYTIHNCYVWLKASDREARGLQYKKIDRFIAVSNPVKTYFNKYFKVSLDKITVIPNGHLIYKPSGVRNKITRDYLKTNKSDYIFFCPATFTPVKQQNLIIEAMKLIKNKKIKVVIMGSHPVPLYIEELKKRIEECRLNDVIRIFPRISSKLMPQIYKLVDCLLMPSITEGWSMAVMEAIEAGKPLLLSRVGSAEEVIKENGIIFDRKSKVMNVYGENLFKSLKPDARDINILSGLIEEVYQRREYFKIEGEKSKSLLNKYTMERQIREYQKIFSEVSK